MIRDIILHIGHKLKSLQKISAIPHVLKRLTAHRFKNFRTNEVSDSFSRDYKNWLDDLIQVLLGQKKGAFIDIGARSGQNLLKLANFQSDRYYIGFEPQVKRVLKIEELIKHKKLERHFIYPLGLGDKTGFNHSDYEPKSLNKGWNSNSIPKSSICLKGDDIIPSFSLENICIIKIDVGGREAAAISGLVETIKLYRPCLIFEVVSLYNHQSKSPFLGKEADFRQDQANRITIELARLNYTVFQIFAGKGLQEQNAILLDQSPDQKSYDYLAIANEEIPKLKQWLNQKTDFF